MSLGKSSSNKELVFDNVAYETVSLKLWAIPNSHDWINIPDIEYLPTPHICLSVFAEPYSCAFFEFYKK